MLLLVGVHLGGLFEGAGAEDTLGNAMTTWCLKMEVLLEVARRTKGKCGVCLGLVYYAGAVMQNCSANVLVEALVTLAPDTEPEVNNGYQHDGGASATVAGVQRARQRNQSGGHECTRPRSTTWALEA